MTENVTGSSPYYKYSSARLMVLLPHPNHFTAEYWSTQSADFFGMTTHLTPFTLMKVEKADSEVRLELTFSKIVKFTTEEALHRTTRQSTHSSPRIGSSQALRPSTAVLAECIFIGPRGTTAA